ncbi:hypothetical protein MKX03_016208 [Papaver bracteatum]|nr:hypothetical protein MKX03_016208 [Papaver bracteatum]
MVEIHDISPSTDKETILVNYIVTGSDGTDHNIDIPSKGRVFDDDDEIYNFYKEYRNDDGCLRCVSFGCARGGKHQRKAVSPRGSMETGWDGKWVMPVVKLEHNHKCNLEDVKSYKCFQPVCSSAGRIDLISLWHWMLVEYGLQDNQWLKDLFEERSCWVPCYLKDTFWAGISSNTQRSEGSNVFFDGYIDARSSIKKLVEQYEVALRKIVEKEKLADDASSLKTIPLVTTYPMEKQIQKRHALSVLCHNGVRKLPDKYILRWWRKDVIRAHTKVKVGYSCWTNHEATKCYHDLCTKSAELAALATNDETLYRDILNWLDCKKKELQQTL